MWARQPAPRPIVISREKADQPSTWAVFPLTTPEDGSVVTIEVTLLYQGKPLQAATYVSPVRDEAVDEDERPTLTVHNLSGPDEPTDDMRPVAVSLDGTGAELTRKIGNPRQVLITQVQTILDAIEELVCRVTADERASETLDDEKSVKLLIDLARIGVQLRASCSGWTSTTPRASTSWCSTTLLCSRSSWSTPGRRRSRTRPSCAST